MPAIETNYVPVADKAYDFKAYLRPRAITLDCLVTGTNTTNLVANLDGISRLINPQNGVKTLVLDAPSDRYYNAKPDSAIDWEIIGDKLASGQLRFVCPDPLGYANSATSSNYNINADPKTVSETTVGGTAYIEPVWTLTAGGTLSSVTIKVKNNTTVEEIQWTGSLTVGQTLVINVPLWIVYKVGVASMATVTGQFPRLLPNQANSITVTAFGTTGTMNIAYRNTYL
jgi:hypothetical protein